MPQIPGAQARTRVLRLWRIVAPLLIFALAVFARLDFLENIPQLPDTLGDQVGYMEQARQLAQDFGGAWSNVLMQNATAKDGIWPILMAPAYMTADPIRTLQIGQAFFFGSLSLAVILIVRRVTTPEWGWVAGLIVALYPPLIIATGRFLQQAPVGVAFTWALACLLYFDRRRHGRWLLVAGYVLLTMTGYILLVTRPAMLALMVVFPVGRNRRNRIMKWGYLGTLVLLMVLWSMFASGTLPQMLGAPSAGTTDLVDTFLQTSVGMSRYTIDASAPFNFGAFLETDLWFAESHGQRADVGLPPLERSGLMEVFASDPVNAVGGFLTNGYRLFLQPYNSYAQPYLIDYDGQLALHRFWLLFAVLGAMVSLAQPGQKRGRFVWPVLLVTAVIAIIYPIIHVESRYRSPLDAVQIVLALLGLHWVFTQCWQRRWRIVGALGGIWVANGLVDVPTVLAVLPAMSPAVAHALDVLVEGATWALTAVIIVGATWPPEPVEIQLPRKIIWRWRLTPVLTIAFGLALMLVIIVARLWDQNWRDWPAVLVSGERIQQVITLGDFTPPPDTVPVFLLDVGAPEEELDLRVVINGVEIKPAGEGLWPWAASPRINDIVAQGTSIESHYARFLNWSGGYVTDFRRWGFMSPDPALWENEDEIRIEVIATGSDPITIWGDYAEDAAVFAGPSLSVWGGGRSFYRFMWSKDDRRLVAFNDLMGLEYRSMRNNGAGEPVNWPGGEDLSAAFGLQTGRYRVYMLWLPMEEIIPYYTPAWMVVE